MKDYDVLNELVPMTQELHRLIFDKGYEQGFKDGANLEYEHNHAVVKAYHDGQAFILDKIKAEIEQDAFKDVNGSKYIFVNRINQIIDKYSTCPNADKGYEQGHWISFGIQGEMDGQIVRAFTCSKCGAISIFRMTDGKIVNGDLCPNCEAKMQEVKNESCD